MMPPRQPIREYNLLASSYLEDFWRGVVVTVKKRLAVLVCALVLAVGLAPGLAFAATSDLQAGDSQLVTQAKDLSKCTVKFKDSGKSDSNSYIYRTYFVKGKKAVAKPSFDLYYNGSKVPAGAYTVSYELTWWDDEEQEDQYKAVSASQLYPSKSPVANNQSMASEFRITATAKAGSGYEGAFNGDDNGQFTALVVDYYNIGRYMDCYMTKMQESWHYSINPMNNGYYVIPQTKVKATLNSLTLLAAGTTGEGGMNHDGEKVASKYYTVSYYKADKDAIHENASPATEAITGKKLKSMPTTAGSYVAVVEGKSPYYGSASFLFDIQGSMKDVRVEPVNPVKENGKERKPALTVTYKGKELTEGTDYEVEYRNNVKAGTASAIITGSPVVTNDGGYMYDAGKARFFTGSKTVKFNIAKNAKKSWKDNTLKTSDKATIKVKAKTLQGRGDQTYSLKSKFKVKDAKGTLTFEQLTTNSLFTVSKKGAFKVARFAGLPHIKGKTFDIMVRVAANGSSTYYAASKILSLTVKIV